MIDKSTMDKIIKINEQREKDMNPLYCLGRRLLDGDGVEQDKSLGMEVIRTVAEQGDVFAQSDLGSCLLEGRGIKQDIDEGVKWLKMAAENGSKEAKKKLFYISCGH